MIKLFLVILEIQEEKASFDIFGKSYTLNWRV